MKRNGAVAESTQSFFGEFGGSFLPKVLQKEMDKLSAAYEDARHDPAFFAKLDHIRRHYQGRLTPITHVRNLSAKVAGAQIFFKREDLNHTGAHKLNHCMGECLLAKRLGKRRVIAEIGAGQHGLALATAATFFGLECEIHMGEVDMAKEQTNVQKMRLLGATVVSVGVGQRTLKEAVDSAFAAYLANLETCLYCIGSAVGPHPFPTMVRDFQSVVGREAREQMLEMTGHLPDAVVAGVRQAADPTLSHPSRSRRMAPPSPTTTKMSLACRISAALGRLMGPAARRISTTLTP
jgi:tryptophan synthase beta subunit